MACPPPGGRCSKKLAMQLLRDRPQLASLYVGDPEGNFLMVQRSPEGALDTKVIEHDGELSARSPGTDATRRGRSKPSRKTRPTPTIPAPAPGIEARPRSTACSGPTSTSSLRRKSLD